MPIKLVRRHGSPWWYMRGTVRGIRIDESTGLGDRRKAEEVRARREAEVLEESIHGRRAVATFASAALSYMERGGEKRYVGALLAHFGTLRLSAIDQAAIDRCAGVLKPGAAASTINRQVHTPISAILKHAAKRGMCASQPIERPAQPDGKTRWLTIDEASRLVAACSDHMRPLVTFMLCTGARLSEALYLDWGAVDLPRAHVAFLHTKNGEPRGVPLHETAVVALANIGRRDGAVFRRPDGQPYEIRDYGGGQIRTGFRAACRRAGIKGATPHTLRHTWASWYYAQTRDLLGLMRLGGWKTQAMVMRYAHVNVEDLAGSISKISGEFAGTFTAASVKILTR